jgi:hypothetical protein
LAAVLASSYDYDTVDGDDDMSEANLAESMAYLDISEHDEDVYEEGRNLNQSVSGSFDFGCCSPPLNDSEQSNSRPRQSRVPRQPRERIKNKVALSRSRHRRRRYDILSELLLSSADLLMLEKSQSKGFLPMLAKLLVPQPKNESNTDQRPPLWRRPITRIQGQSPSEQGDREAYTAAEGTFKSRKSDDSLRQQLDRIEHLGPFLESLSPGAGVRCLALLIFQHLLHSEEGYDARVRHVVKTLGVIVLIHDMESDPVDVDANNTDSSTRRTRALSFDELVALATRKFESLEHCIASKLLRISQVQQELAQANAGSKKRSKSKTLSRQSQELTRDQIMRGFKIGGAAVIAGTLFAVTGGLAAPGIAAGVAALAGSTAATAAAAALLTSTAAVTTIFGVGGGGLAAYKMQRRTQGLTHFEFRKEKSRRSKSDEEGDDTADAELFSTICLSGWLRDKYDFQRPWGIMPSHPRLTDRLELLERFYSVYSPDHVLKSAQILASWKGEEQELWNVLRKKYGRDPDHLFPFDDGPRLRGALTHEQQEIVDDLFVELGYVASAKDESGDQATPFERMRVGWKERFKHASKAPTTNRKSAPVENVRMGLRDSLHGPHADDGGFGAADVSSVASSGFESVSTGVSMLSEGREEMQENSARPKHLSTVWDYQASYGGELYTVQWENHLLTELCDSVSDLAYDVVSGGTAQLLKHTALSTLMSAIAWPYALVNAANMIDGTWTLAVERADEAGKELARSLLFSRAGNRPVTLVGFSFGARTIYSCLKELAMYQENWEDYQEMKFSSMQNGKVTQPVVENEGSENFYKHMREPASIVEDAIIMGLPNHLSLTSWKVCRQVVSGRLVNCYSRKDLILSLMFQFKRLGIKPVCGTCPVNVSGVENIDVTDLIAGHQDYCLVAGDVLKRVRHGQPFRSDSTTVFVPYNLESQGPVEA